VIFGVVIFGVVILSLNWLRPHTDDPLSAMLKNGTSFNRLLLQVYTTIPYDSSLIVIGKGWLH
jgi:hypothetical protein